MSQQDFVNGAGALFIATSLTGMLTGIVVTQANTYFQTNRDPLWLKLLLVIETVCTLVNFGVSFQASWWYLIEQRTAPLSIAFQSPPSLIYLAAVTQVSQGLAQSFFAYRAYRVQNKSIAVAIFFLILILGGLATGFASFFWLLLKGNLIARGDAHDLKVITVLVQFQLWVPAVTDICITACLSGRLRKERKGFSEETDGLLTRLIRVSITTAAMTSVVAVTEAILVQALSTKNPANRVYEIFGLQLPPLYALTIFYTLNVRDSVRGIFDSESRPTGPKTGKALSQRKFVSSNIPTGVIVQTQHQVDIEDSCDGNNGEIYILGNLKEQPEDSSVEKR